MELHDLQPKEVKFSVSGVELTFRPFTIADDLKANEICGSQKKLGEAFGAQDLQILTHIAWYQLTIESQRLVMEAVEGVYIDPETGEEQKANLTPLAKFRHLFSTVREKAELTVHLLNCRGLNIPNLDDEEGLKKWIALVGPVIKELTGEKSST